MPTVLRVGPYRVYFFSDEREEPPHVHVDRDDCLAKYWLGPVTLARSVGFRPVELRRIRRILIDYETVLAKAWHEHLDP